MPKRKLSQARAAGTRAKILHAARNQFAEHGFDGASVRDIAKTVGTTHSMVTYHFGTKEELWRESVRDMFALLRREVLDPVAAEADLPLKEQFRLLTYRYVRYCAQHPEHARITIAETIRGGERLDWMVENFVREDHNRAFPTFQQLIDEGYLPKMELTSFLYSYVGMMQMPFVLAKEAEAALAYDFMSEEAITRHADSVLHLIFRDN